MQDREADWSRNSVWGDICEGGRGVLRSIFSGALQPLSLPSHPCSCTLGCQGDPGSQLTAKCFSRSSYRAVVLTPHSLSKSGLLLLFMVLYLVPDIMTEPGPGQALMGLRKTLKFIIHRFNCSGEKISICEL